MRSALEMLKKMKVENIAQAPPPPVAQNKGKGRAVTVTDVTDEDEEMEDGSGFAPGGDADYFAEEDQDGRFFGGGLTGEQKQVMDILDKHVGESAQDEDVCILFCVESGRASLSSFHDV